MRGRKPRPKEEKIARGETRPSRVNYDEPDVPEATVGKPPSDLKGAGLKLWRDHAAAMTKRGQLRETDVPLFLRACRTAMDIEYWRKEFAKANIQRPELLQIQRTIDRLEGLYVRHATELGMGPVSRSRVKTVTKAPVKKEAKDRFFGKGSKPRVIAGGRK